MIIKFQESSEDGYCDPIDVQRKETFQPDLKNKANKDDYCEPWDTTKKTDFGNAPRKTSHSDDEHNEYMDPYDTGKDGIIEKRRSRGIGKDFHSKIQQPNGELQRKSIPENNQPDPRYGRHVCKMLVVAYKPLAVDLKTHS